MFENLSDRLERSFKILKGEGKISEINIAETLKEIRKEMLEQVPDYARNPYLRKKCALRAMDCLLRCFPSLALRLIPVYIRKTNQVV